MHRKLLLSACLGLISAGLSHALLAEDMTVNRLLAAQCAQCHGTNGHAVGNIDGLRDESYKDLYEDLMDMRGEDRAEDIMDHQALGYTADQIRRIALYYGTLAGKADEAPENLGSGAGSSGSGSDNTDSSSDDESEREERAYSRSERKKRSKEERRRYRRERDDD